MYDFTKANIYILKLQDDKYYIGKTYKHILERYMEHCRGEGSAWTRKYPPICILEEYNEVMKSEIAVTRRTTYRAEESVANLEK